MQKYVDAQKGKLQENWDKTTKEILAKLEVDEKRMQDIEMQQQKHMNFENKFLLF